jgi:hypothetical protein
MSLVQDRAEAKQDDIGEAPIEFKLTDPTKPPVREV